MAETWTLTEGEREHVVVVEGSLNHKVRWEVDGEEVATRSTMDDKVQVEAAGLERSLGVWFGFNGAPRRVTLFEGGTGAAALGLGGTDLVPPAGSSADRRERRMRENPRAHEAIALVEGLGKVVVPIAATALVIWLARLIPWPSLDLPSIPWPSIDLPSIPWPSIDLPSIPWPDLPDWSLPGWLRWVLDHLKYVVPILVAYAAARGEIRRRRKQDERRETDQG